MGADATLAVSAVELGVEVLVEGADGADATEVSALELGVAVVVVEAVSVFIGAGIAGVLATGLSGAGFKLSDFGVERGAVATLAGSAGAFDLLLLGAGAAGLLTSATFMLSFESTGAEATSAGGVAADVVSGVTALTGGAAWGTTISLSFRL